MITKLEGTKNGYDVLFATSEEWEDLIKDMEISTIYMNKNTRKHFRCGLLGSPCITIVNRLSDMVVYINGLY